MKAAGGGHVEVTRCLLEAGADHSLKDKNYEGGGNTALHYAAWARQVETAAELIKAGADVNSVSKSGNTPLTLLFEDGPSVSSLSVEERIERDEKGISGTEASSIYRIAKFFLDSGANPNGVKGEPLQCAAEQGLIEVVKLLLAAGADPNLKSDQGWTAFTFVVDKHEKIAELLLNSKLDLELKDKTGKTPLAWAALTGSATLVSRLIQLKADVNAQDKRGLTPLDLALRESQKGVASMIRKAGGKSLSKKTS